MDQQELWNQSAQAYEWMVPWRYLKQDGRWYVGGYSNVALNVLDRHLEERADQTAVVDRMTGQRATYRALYWQSARLARWLKRQGMGIGDRLAVFGTPAVEGLVATLASMRLGGVVVILPPAASDAQLAQCLSDCEVQWAVATGHDSHWERLHRVAPSAGIGVLAAEQNHEMTVKAAIDAAEGLLDPVPVEANAMEMMVYGDASRPYAYAGMGLLVGLRHSLASLLDLAPGDRVGLRVTHGGLAHPLIMTTMMLGFGCQVVWTGPDCLAAVREHGLTALVTTSRSFAEAEAAADRVEHILVLDADGRRQPSPRGRARWVWAQPVMEDGLLQGEGSLNMGAAPSADRTDGESRTQPAPPREEPLTAQMEDLVRDIAADPDVREVAVTAVGEQTVVWVASSRTREALLDHLRARREDAEVPESLMLVVTANFPETVEGRLAISVLTALGRGESRIALDGLANPEVVGQLAEARFSGEVRLS